MTINKTNAATTTNAAGSRVRSVSMGPSSSNCSNSNSNHHNSMHPTNRRSSSSSNSETTFTPVSSSLVTPLSSSSLTGIDDRALALTLLLSQQEAQYGVNMFDFLPANDPEVQRLVNQGGYSNTDAMIAVFERYPPLPKSEAAAIHSKVRSSSSDHNIDNSPPPRYSLGYNNHKVVSSSTLSSLK